MCVVRSDYFYPRRCIKFRQKIKSTVDSTSLILQIISLLPNNRTAFEYVFYNFIAWWGECYIRSGMNTKLAILKITIRHRSHRGHKASRWHSVIVRETTHTAIERDASVRIASANELMNLDTLWVPNGCIIIHIKWTYQFVIIMPVRTLNVWM